jgi:hypothetical protein
MKRTGQAAPRIPLIRNSQIAVPIDGGATAAHRPSPAHYEISADPPRHPQTHRANSLGHLSTERSTLLWTNDAITDIKVDKCQHSDRTVLAPNNPTS